MKHLIVTYDGREIFDGDIAEFTWQESEDEITVRGRTKPKMSVAQALGNAAARANKNSVPKALLKK